MKKETYPIHNYSETLHPALKEAFGYRLMHAAMKYRKALLVILDEFKIVPPQMAMLKILEDPEQLNQRDLGLELGLDKVGTLRMIDGLEEMKLVKRITNENDKREKMIQITKKGREVIAEIKKRNVIREKNFLAPLTTEEAELFKKLLMKL